MRFPAIAAFALLSVASSSAQTTMTFQCEDLRDAGLVLVPVTSPDFAPLLTDIQQRIDHPSPDVAAMNPILRKFAIGTVSSNDRATSAILLNHSDKSIAMMELVWRYEEIGGRTYTRSRELSFGRNLLLNPSSANKFQLYWNTILPGSKRYLGEDGMAGDNTDVRPPAPDEIWKGGGGGGSGGGLRNAPNPIKSVTLILDGVFFTDGEFVGPDQFGLWESVTTEAKTRLEVATTARDGKAQGASAADILSEIGKLTGPVPDAPPPPPPPRMAPDAAWYRQYVLRTLAREIERMRQMNGDDRTVDTLAARIDPKLPDFRKR